MLRSSRAQQGLHWCGTINGNAKALKTDEEYLSIFEGMNLKYLVFSRERSSTGTPHIQFYVEFLSKIRLTAIKKIPVFETAHLEQRAGPRNAAREYCMKSDTHVSGPFEVGEWNETAQGKRTDLEALAATARQPGATFKRVADEHPAGALRYSNGITKMLGMCCCLLVLCCFSFVVGLSSERRTSPPIVTLLFGPPGCGKTRHVYDITTPDELWRQPLGKGQWFDFYDHHTTALFDDFAGALSGWTLVDFLQVTDR